jgi:hypothetical protein
VDAAAFQLLHEEWDQLARSVDEFCGELEAADQERDATMRLSEEMEE